MNKDRRTSTTVGILFIIATIAGIISVMLLGPIIENSDIILAVKNQPNIAVTGTIFEIIMAISCALIACFVFPILKRYNSGLAVSYVGLRVIEGTMFMIGASIMMTIISISLSADTSNMLLTAEILNKCGNMIFEVGATMLLGIMTIIINGAFYKYRLIPRWLSVWGVLAGSVQLVGSMVAFYTIGQNIDTSIFAFPVAIGEMVLAVWLIAKGFSTKDTAKNI